MSNIKLPKAPSKMMNPLTEAEINRLLSSQNALTAIGSRNTAILVTLLDCGLRSSELCNLLFNDARIEEGYLKVLGKGNKERVVPIGSLAQKVLWRYVFHFRPDPLGETNEYLFLTLEMVRRYVHFSSTQDMIKGHVSSPLDRIGMKKLRGYKIDRLLNGRPH